MPLIPVKCQCCGGNFEIPEDANRFFCNYCGTLIVEANEDLKKINVDGVVQVRNADFDVQGGVLVGYHGESVHVEIPDGVKKIHRGCFENMMVETIIIPQSVIEIGEKTFKGCKQLIEVELPPKLESIEAFTFQQCQKLARIVIPEDVGIIKKGAFNECHALEEILFKGDSVKSLDEGSFCGCKSLKKMVVPNKCQEIDKFAFCGCVSLEEIVIPEGITELKESVFEHCKKLQKVQLPCTLSKIHERAFYSCENLERLMIPDGVNRIKKDALADTSIKELSIPSSLVFLEETYMDFFGSVYQRNSFESIEVIHLKSNKQIGKWLFSMKKLQMVYCNDVPVDMIYASNNAGVNFLSGVYAWRNPWCKALCKQKTEIEKEKDNERKEAEERQSRIDKRYCPDCDIPLKSLKLFDKRKMGCPKCGKEIEYKK